ncbi:hypothetical protein AVEN_82494-1 [Araneus ventricosus]|uniref:Uncharacterized protein n=1 Tax=Araneus ventricosus TaxID=182803 RepID=A0A4Y2Q3F7_ARAVE|nr:hypothetical protein AVEN_82494-1 [Araneus ventricosus]
MAWPPRSPDITPLDFYLWGYVKQHVYSERINDINHSKQRITDVIHSAAPDVLTCVWEELDHRLDVCRATNGAHIEQVCKPGVFSSYWVKMSPVCLVSLLSRDRSKVHHDFTDTLYMCSCSLVFYPLREIEYQNSWQPKYHLTPFSPKTSLSPSIAVTGHSAGRRHPGSNALK